MATGGLYCACPNGTLTYRDADGDGYGDAALVGTSCDGAIPIGYVANQADCNDAVASVHPGAVEACNGLDDDCDGSVDDAAVPGAVGTDTFPDVVTYAWNALADAQMYDVVMGDVGLLRTSGGDFTAAMVSCIAFHINATSSIGNGVPAVGSAWWFVVRGNNCGGAGTYDSGGPGQVGSRDAELDASPLSCTHSVCGDRVCNGEEDCYLCAYDCGECPCTSDAECIPSSCCNPTGCIPAWREQYCPPTCDDDCPFVCITGCACQDGVCIGVY